MKRFPKLRSWEVEDLEFNYRLKFNGYNLFTRPIGGAAVLLTPGSFIERLTLSSYNCCENDIMLAYYLLKNEK